ncbi:MAG: hypothetical protein A2Y77_03135 [Planctomycetes bacterium RBG_13_62_9]|nr:MAG: hypothetical protein A2Y77_03135 [Planctomycetes bacterium RBG_13_62_9]
MRRLWLGIGIGAIGTAMLAVCLAPAWADADKTYNPVIDPANFVSVIDNPYFPLTPGTTFTYEAETADGLERDVVSVTHDTKVILGVTCIAVTDQSTLDGVIEEDTVDWYAQDIDGNVWYFGEDTKQYENGEVVGTVGSWEAGMNGAQPGIVMQADPQPGASYRQEFLAGVAEDMGKVLRLNARVSVEWGDFDSCLKTKEWSPLEPGAVEQKYYAQGVGLVLIEELKGKTVRVELVDVTTE